jgi:hypothetical protein
MTEISIPAVELLGPSRGVLLKWRLAMRRVVSLFLPTWSTDRVGRTLGGAAPPAEAPLVLIGRDGRRRAVLAADAGATTQATTRDDSASIFRASPQSVDVLKFPPIPPLE